jgi:succinate dehydrogenase/fumarate reductase cytochrome b subunit
VVVASLFIHIVANFVLYIRRRQREKNPKARKPVPLAQKINRIAGTLISLMVFGHMFGFRVLGFLDPTHSGDFSMVTFSLFAEPTKFAVYFLAFGAAGLYHLCYGLLKASDLLFGSQLTSKTTKSLWFFGAALSGLALVASSVYAFRGGYFDVRASNARMKMWAEHFAYVMGIAYRTTYDFTEVAALLSKD